MMRVPYLWLFVTGLCNDRVCVDVFYLPIVPRGIAVSFLLEVRLPYCASNIQIPNLQSMHAITQQIFHRPEFVLIRVACVISCPGPVLYKRGQWEEIGPEGGR